MEVARLSLVLNSVETKNNQYKNIEMLKQKRCLQMVSKMYFNFFLSYCEVFTALNQKSQLLSFQNLSFSMYKMFKLYNFRLSS